MIGLSANLLSNVTLHSEAAILLFSRISASVFLLPAFGEHAIPARVKLVGALALSALVFSLAYSQIRDNSIASHGLEMAILAETVNGLVIGFSFRCLVFTLQICGTIAAQSTSLSQSFGAGLGTDPQPAFATLLVVSCLCLLSILNWHIHILNFYVSSLEPFPLGARQTVDLVSEWGIGLVGWVFANGFALAATFVAVSLIFNVGLGFINKAMPQLMVALVGAPAASFLGILALFATGPIILLHWQNELLPTVFTPQGRP